MIILTEKPSVAKSFASALNVNFNKAKGYYKKDDIIITNCLGHLYELAKPEAYSEKYKFWSLENLPIIPEKFLYEEKEITAKQSRLVTKLLRENQNEKIIVATDADREGEIIARIVLLKSGIKDFSNCYRFWESEALTKEIIIQGMNKIKPLNEYNFLSEKGFARQKADWLVGMNFSPYATLLSGGKITFAVGRVQTALLNAIAQRNDEVKNFIPVAYYECIASLYDKNNNHIEARLINPENNQFRFDSLNHYINQAHTYSQTNKEISYNINTKRKTLTSPSLLGLTELQQLASKLYDYSPKKTLNIAQKLYEEYKCLSYPRTPSTVMGNDDVKLFKEKFDLLKNDFELSKYCDEQLINQSNRKIFNSNKLDSHHALIPLDKLPQNAIEQERNIYNLVAKYFFMSCMSECIYDDKELKIQNGEYIYKVNIKTVIEKGWTICKDKLDENEEEIITFDEKSMILKETKIEKKMTKPKKEFTINSLLAFMKNPTSQIEDDKKLIGLGTSATRAEIIQKLQDHQYININNKKLYATEKGYYLLRLLQKNDLTKKITEISQTTKWEAALESSPKDFEKDIKDYINQTVSQKLKIESFINQAIGKCPLCNKNIYENKKSFYCEGYKNEPKCNFTIWKEIAYSKIDNKDVVSLLSGKTTNQKKMKNKDGKYFFAKLKLNKEGKIEFIFEPKKN